MLNATMPTKNKIHNTKIPKPHNRQPTTKNQKNYEFSRKIRKLY